MTQLVWSRDIRMSLIYGMRYWRNDSMQPLHLTKRIPSTSSNIPPPIHEMYPFHFIEHTPSNPRNVPPLHILYKYHMSPNFGTIHFPYGPTREVSSRLRRSHTKDNSLETQERGATVSASVEPQEVSSNIKSFGRQVNSEISCCTIHFLYWLISCLPFISTTLGF